MEEIDLLEIEKIAKTKKFSELSKKEMFLIKKHFGSEEEYENFRLIISQDFEEDYENFPTEIDNFVFEKLNKDEKKVIMVFPLLKKIAAVVLLLISFGSGWILNNKKGENLIEIVKNNTDTIYINNEIVMLDTIEVNKYIFKEKIVKIFIEKEPKVLREVAEIENNYDSIPFSTNNLIVDKNSLDKLDDLNEFFTEF